MVNPYLGDKPLATVDNKALKELVATLKAANLSAKTIVEIVGVAKWVVASAIDEATGKKKFPREWNHDFIDLPVVESTEQARPTLHAEEVAACIANAKGRYRVLYALLAGTGLRIGEALAIHLEDGDHTTISTDCKTIHVRKSVWRGKEQEPKTPAAKRSVDLCESLAAYLRQYIGGRTSGLLFQSDSGLPLAQSNIYRDSFRRLNVEGFHTFRRFRASQLVEADCPEDLKKYWIGHATKGVTELYGKQSTKVLRRRQEWAEKVGLGFRLIEPQCTPLGVASAA